MTEPRDHQDRDPDVPVEGLSYSEASTELDSIVHFFEQRDVDVDQLVGRLVRATALVEELDSRLRQTRLQVEQLVPRLTAVLSDSPSGAPGSSGLPQADSDPAPDAGDAGPEGADHAYDGAYRGDGADDGAYRDEGADDADEDDLGPAPGLF